MLRRSAGSRTPAIRITRSAGLMVEKILHGDAPPGKMALTVAMGVSLGILPMAWGTSLLCAAVAALLRLNQGAIQAVNFAVCPLQLALLLPFFRLGQRIIPAGTLCGHAPPGGVFALFAGAGEASVKAIAAWFLVAPGLVLLLYGCFLPVFRKRSATD